MNIIFIATECYPFAKVSSLADLVCSLSKGIEKEGHNVKVFMPRYGCIDPSICHIERLPLDLRSHNKSVAPISVYKGILPNSLVNIFFIENQNHFSNSKEIYLGKSIDEERFTFFSQATLEVLLKLKAEPHLIHLFNPYTTYIARLLHSKIPIVFTIHNTEELSEGGLTNIIKETMHYSDFITTCSDLSNAKNPDLNNVLRILSSIDEDIYNPESDTEIAQTYSKNYFSIGKRRCKEDLLERIGLEKNLQIPLFGIISRLSSEKEFEILIGTLHEINYLNLQLVLLVKGKETYEHELLKLASRHKRLKVFTAYDNDLSKKIYAGSDFFIDFNNCDSGGIPVLIAMKYGCVPVAYSTGVIKEIIVDISSEKEANGFTFKNYSKEGLTETIIKAIKHYKNKEAWTKLVKEAMSFNSNNSACAKKYINCYEKTIQNVGAYCNVPLHENVLQ